MIEIFKRIGEFSKEYNRLMSLFCKTTPTSLQTVKVWEEYPLELQSFGDEGEYVYREKPCNTGGDLNTDGIVFPNSKEIGQRASIFYEDCDTLILNEQDSILRQLLDLFKFYEICIKGDQFVNAGMYDEMNLLELLNVVYRYARDLSFEDIAKRREFLLSQKKESSHDMESTNVSKQDNSKQERTDNESGINEQGKIIYPSGLDTGKAKELLRKVQEKGLCDDRFDWKRSKTLFAYFAAKASDELVLSERLKGRNENNKAVSWKPFETLFTIKGKHISGLAQALKDFENKGGVKGQKDIDSLF